MWAAAVTLCTRAVGVSEPDVLVTHLAIERAGDYDLIGRPVVHYCMVRLQAPCYGHVKCVSHVCTVLGLKAEKAGPVQAQPCDTAWRSGREPCEYS